MFEGKEKLLKKIEKTEKDLAVLERSAVEGYKTILKNTKSNVVNDIRSNTIDILNEALHLCDKRKSYIVELISKYRCICSDVEMLELKKEYNKVDKSQTKLRNKLKEITSK